MTQKKARKIIELVVYILTAIASFLGGQASAKSGMIDLFNKQSININK